MAPRQTNPFQYLMPVVPEESVGRWPLVRKIVDDLVRADGSSYVILGGRRCGKTSLLRALERALRDLEAATPRDTLYALPINIDFSALGTDSQVHFFAQVTEQLRRTLDHAYLPPELDQVSESRDASRFLNAFVDATTEVVELARDRYGPMCVVLLIDEMDQALNHSWTESFFNQLRHLVSSSRIAQSLRLVIASAGGILDEQTQASPLYNLLARAYLEVFTENETFQLIGRAGQVSQAVADAVVQQSGGHPFLVQFLMYHLWEKGLDRITPNSVEEVVSQLTFERHDILESWYESIGPAGQVVYAILARTDGGSWLSTQEIAALASDSLSTVNRALLKLLYHGLAVRDSTQRLFRCAGDLFRNWFLDNYNSTQEAQVSRSPDTFVSYESPRAEQSIQDPASYSAPKVLVLNFDPPLRSEGNRRLHEALGWQDPRRLAEAYISHLAECSGGYVRYQIARWEDVGVWPAKTDGFRYDEESFLQNWRSRSGWHQPDAIDYEALLADFDLLGRIETGQIDEVWLFGFPYAGFYESVMVGRDALWCNAPPIPRREVSRRFVIMGFSYERGVGPMLESFGHRVESILKQTFASWKPARTNPWERFIQYDKQSPGQAGCGWMHYAPNSVSDFDWGNRDLVWSTCDDWLNYPNLTGQRRQVNCEEWGNGDMLAHHLWWFRHLPHAPGRSQGVLNNWWAYAVTLRVEDTVMPDLRVTPETLPWDVPRLLELLEQNAASRGAGRLLRGRQEQEKTRMRRAIAGVLGELGDKQAVDPLVAMLQDRDADVRLAAVQALGQIGDARAIDALDKTAAADADARVREAAAAALTQIDPMPRVGRIFANQYQILQEMERGGLTHTYRARDIRLEREVVLRVVKAPPEIPTFLPAFEREGDTFARLQHPNLVRVLGYNASAIRPFYDREPVGDESSLRDLLARRGPLSLAEAVAIANQIAAALDYLHQQTPPLIHQHVKPAHILLVGEPDSLRAILTDALATRAFTTAGLQAGTPAYTSPEQAEGRLDRISPQTDVYALGVTAYEMLTGRTPFIERETPDLLRAHIQESPPSPRQFVPEMSDQVSAALLKALAKAPEERYPSAEAFAAALHGSASAEASVSLARDLAQQGLRERALEAAGQALVAAESLETPAERLKAFRDLARLLTDLGEEEHRQVALNQAEDAADSLQDPTERLEAFRDLARLLTDLGEEERRQVALNQAEDAADSLQDPTERLEAFSDLARLLTDLGEEERRRVALNEARAAAEAFENGGDRARALLDLAQGVAQAGDTTQAREIMEQASLEAEAIGDKELRSEILAAMAELLPATAEESKPLPIARTVRIGLHGRNDAHFTEADFELVRRARVETLNLLSLTDVSVFARLRGENPDLQFLVRLIDRRFSPSSRPGPADFVAGMVPVIQQLRPYTDRFEIHSEPNHSVRVEGWGSQDEDARSFREWYLQVLSALRAACPWARFGFPGLAVGGEHRDLAWLEICRDAVEISDWLSCHCYWQYGNMLRDEEGLRFKLYHERFPDKRIEVTEFGDYTPALPPGQMAEGCVRFYQELYNYPYLGSACAFLASSPDKSWSAFTWITPVGEMRPVVDAVGAMERPTLVEPAVPDRVEAAVPPGVESEAPAGVKPEPERQFWFVTANPKQYDWNVAFAKGSEQWTGVLGAEAQQNLRQARPGDVVLAYRSSPDRYVAGLGRIAGQPYEYQGRHAVQIDMDLKLETGVSLDELKQATPDLQHVTRPRPLSFSPVTAEQWAVIRELIRFHNPDLPPDNLPPMTVPQYHGLAIESVDMPTECLAGEPVQVTLHLRNRGNLTWRTGERLAILCRWQPADTPFEADDWVAEKAASESFGAGEWEKSTGSDSGSWDESGGSDSGSWGAGWKDTAPQEWVVEIDRDVPPGGALLLDNALQDIMPPGSPGRFEAHWTASGQDWEEPVEPATAVVMVDIVAPSPPIEVLDRLSPSSENALLWAEGLRQKLDTPELYTEYLLAGLYQTDEGPTRRLLTLFDDETTVDALLQGLVNQPSGGDVALADVQPASREALRRLPLSANTDQTLTAAAALADEKDSTSIHSQHLLAGLLAAPESVDSQVIAEQLEVERTELYQQAMPEPIASQWIVEQLQVERETLYRLIADAPEQEPPLLDIWWASARRVTVLTGHTGAVASLAFALEGTLLASGSEDATMRTWNLLRGTALGDPLQLKSPVHDVIVTPDGARRIMALADGSLTEMSLDGDTTIVMPTVGGDVVQVAEGAVPPALASSPDGQWLATAWPGGALSARNLSTGQQMELVRSLPGPVAALSIGPGASYLATASGLAVSVWSSTGGTELFQLVGHQAPVNALAFTPDGTRLVSASDDRTLRVWDLHSGQELFALHGHDGPVRTVVITLDGQWIVSGADDMTLKIWDPANGRYLATLRGHQAAVTALALSPDGRGLASGDASGVIRLWDLAAVAAELPQPISRKEALARIEFVMGNLLDMPVDALVNPSSTALGLDGNIGRQLVERIGKDLLSRLPDQPTVPLGTALITDAHPLAARYLIHTPIREAPYATLETVVAGAQAALSKADSLGDIHAVAFPALGSGAAGLSPASVASGVLKAVVSHLEQGSRLDRILFTFVEANAYRAYAAAYRALGGIIQPPAWMARLSTSSRRALRLAEALRQHLGAGLLTTGHLLWGLYQKKDGATRRLLTTFDSHEQIVSSLANWLQMPEDLPALQPVPEGALADILLDISGQQAMEEAARLLTDDNIIPERHLLAGLLAVPRSGAAQWIASTLGLTSVQLEFVAQAWQGQEEATVLPDLVRRARRTYALLLGVRPQEAIAAQAAEFAVGQSLFLHVELLPGLPGSQDAFELPPDITELYCFLADASGLHIAGSSVVALPLALLGRQLPKASFALQARLPGPRSYIVELFGEHPDRGGQALAQASGQVTVAVPQAGQAIEPLQPILDLRVAAKPDLVLVVETALPEGEEGPQQLTYRLTCRLPGLRRNNEEVGQVTLQPADLAYIRSLVHRTVAATTGLQPEDARAKMHSLGRYLFDRLFPAGEAAAFRETLWQAQAFWSSHERPGQLPPTWLIIQEEATWLPWELVTPYRLEDDGPVAPLAELYCLGRWVEGLGQTLYGEVPLGDKVLTHYKVLTQEQARQDEELRAWQCVLDARATADSFLPVLKPETNFYGLHLLRHADQVGRTREIMVRAGALRRTSAEDEAQRGRLDLHQRRPVVTLSILDGQGPSPDAADDDWLLPERVLPFLRAGASAVLGPWWPTSEAADQEFWATFYGYLAGRLPLGEAAWRARYAVQRKFPDRPDWLAYTLLGDPRARPYVPEKSQGYTALECLNAEADGTLRPGKTYTFRASIQRRPPTWHQGRLVHAEELPKEPMVLFIVPDLQEEIPDPLAMSPVGQIQVQAAYDLTPQEKGEFALIARFMDGDERLQTLRLSLLVQDPTSQR